MKEKTVEQSDLIGEIKDFPIEVVQEMVNEQVMQGNKADVGVFQIDNHATLHNGGFRFNKSVDGFCFWNEVINRKNFNLFFQKYPKTQSLPEQKCISIEVPDGYEIDNEKSTFNNIVFKPTESKCPKSWEEVFIDSPISGFYIAGSQILSESREGARGYNRSTFKTEKQAKSALAYAQITQLMALSCYNGDWIPDWENGLIDKYSLIRKDDAIELILRFDTFSPITFKSKEVRESFLKNHEDLLRQYFEMD